MALFRHVRTILSHRCVLNSRRCASLDVNKTTKDNNFVVRSATSAHDLQFLPKLISNVGRYDAEAYFSADPTGFFIGELHGEKISHISAAKYSHMIFFGLYVVDEHYRQHGFGMQTCKRAVQSLGRKFQTESLVTVAVPEMKELYEKEFGFRQEWISKAYKFRISDLLSLQRDSSSDALVKAASTVDFEKLLEYDTACFGGSRRSFLQKWIALPGRISLVATDERDDIIGYTVARKMQHPENRYTIGPLFANDVSVAKTLLKETAEKIALQSKQESEITYAVPITEHNTAASELPEELGGVVITSRIGMCKQKLPPSLVAGFSKVFAMTGHAVG